MRELIQSIVHALETGVSVELVSLLESSGSTPRGAGAMLVVFPDGRMMGTVGGGNVEYEAAQLAVSLMERKENMIQSFRFIQGDASDVGIVYGGTVNLHFQYLSAGDETVLTLFRKLLETREQGAWIARKLEGAQVTSMVLADRNGTHDEKTVPQEWLQDGTVWQDGWFVIPVVRAGRVYVFGGGHVSQALVPAIAAVGFRPVVYDDRPEFANPALFPQAEAVFCGSYEALTENITVTSDDYVIALTKGPQSDCAVLGKTLRSGAKYLGCIGSRRKLKLCQQYLLEMGFSEEEYARIHAPIGLRIGAETPAELAVSITAELIAIRAGISLD